MGVSIGGTIVMGVRGGSLRVARCLLLHISGHNTTEIW